MRTRAVSALMRALYQSVVVKKELSQKTKLSIYQLIYIPIFTYGHKLWVVTERRDNVFRMRCGGYKMARKLTPL